MLILIYFSRKKPFVQAIALGCYIKLRLRCFSPLDPTLVNYIIAICVPEQKFATSE